MPDISFVVTRGVSSPDPDEKHIGATPSGGGYFDCSGLSIYIPLRPDSPFVGNASGRGGGFKVFFFEDGGGLSPG